MGRQSEAVTPIVYHFADSEMASAYAGVGADEYEIFWRTYGEFESVTRCAYCQSNIRRWTTVEEFEPKPDDPWWLDEEESDITLIICPGCGWFRYKTFRWISGDYQPEIVDRIATFRNDPVEAYAKPFLELEKYLSKRWSDRTDLSAARAEELIAAVFKDHLDCEVIYTTNGVYTPDGGIDFVLVNSENGVEYAFQIKRRLVNSPERVRPIREFIGAVAGSPYKYAYYVTTADRFTKAAKTEAAKNISNLKSRDIALNLVDGQALRSLLKSKKAVPTTAEKVRKWFRPKSIWNGKLSLEEMISVAFTMSAEDEGR